MKGPILVSTNEYGIPGENFYLLRHEQFNITIAELASLGAAENTAYVDESVIRALMLVNKELREEYGYTIKVKDGYRSPALYEFIHAKRCEIDGEAETNSQFSIDEMPRATGLAVDIALLDSNGAELFMREKEDGTAAYIYGFYADKDDKISKEYHARQTILKTVMKKYGFISGKKKQYWFFVFRSK